MLFLMECTDNDISHAAQLMCRVYSEPPRNENWDIERAEKRVAAFLSGTSARGYAMIIERENIGYLFGRMELLPEGGSFCVDEMYVDPRFQRKGCGSMALSQLGELLKKKDVKTIELHTVAEDINFYIKNGFVPSPYKYLEKTIC